MLGVIFIYKKICSVIYKLKYLIKFPFHVNYFLCDVLAEVICDKIIIKHDHIIIIRSFELGYW